MSGVTFPLCTSRFGTINRDWPLLCYHLNCWSAAETVSGLDWGKDGNDKDSHGTVGLTVMSVAEWAGGGISRSITSLALFTMTPCIVLIPARLSLLMGWMIRRRSRRGTMRGYLSVPGSREWRGSLITPEAAPMTLPYWFWHHLVGICFCSQVLNRSDLGVNMFVSASFKGQEGCNCAAKLSSVSHCLVSTERCGTLFYGPPYSGQLFCRKFDSHWTGGSKSKWLMWHTCMSHALLCPNQWTELGDVSCCPPNRTVP